MTLQLSRAKIIELGLSLAGRPDLVSEARYWLNMFLEEQYMNQDYEWLVKWKGSMSIEDGMDAPLDYRAGKSALLRDTNGELTYIQAINQQEQWDQLRAQLGTVTGAPQYFFMNPNDRKMYFLPSPDAGYSMDLKYFQIPCLPDIDPDDEDADDEETPKWGLPFSILIDHIKARAQEYNDCRSNW